jgi:hypothetical protein
VSLNEELEQATCAVLINGRVQGTAWLCSENGHLLTAGHVLGKTDPAQTVEVRFLNESPRTAKQVTWNYLESSGIDFAVLQLEEPPANRRPLRMSFERDVEGTFVLCGFGLTLQDLSSGKGTFVGNLEVKNSSDLRLFRLRSQELGEGGYSGGAVFSNNLQSVVGIQIEATEGSKSAGRDTILAMPLYRVPQVWDPRSGLRPSGREADTPEAYSYHVLLSYSRTDLVQTWVHEFFLPELKPWLEEELEDRPVIFWDHDDQRNPWARPMVDAVRGSRYMVAILTPMYFKSSHCMAELESFSARESIEKAKLFSAIEWHNNKTFPESIRERCVSFREFAITARGYKNTDGYIRFQQRVKELAETLSALIASAPPYSKTWPVFAPAEVKVRMDDGRIHRSYSTGGSNDD